MYCFSSELMSSMCSTDHHTEYSSLYRCCRVTGYLGEDRRHVENESQNPQFLAISDKLASSRWYVQPQPYRHLFSSWLTPSDRHSLLFVSPDIRSTRQSWVYTHTRNSALLLLNTTTLVLDIVPNASIHFDISGFILIANGWAYHCMTHTHSLTA